RWSRSRSSGTAGCSTRGARPGRRPGTDGGGPGRRPGPGRPAEREVRRGPMERVCFRMQVRPERLPEYIERHRAVWPEMLRALREAGWTNYSLFAQDDGTVIGYLETEDYEAARARMEPVRINAEWQASMRPLFAEGGSFAAGPVRLREVFHLEDRLAASEPAAPAAGTATGGKTQ